MSQDAPTPAPPTEPTGQAPTQDVAAPASFASDESPTNELGERRFVSRLGWFGPVNMLMILGAAIPTSAVAGLMAYNFTARLDEAGANASIGAANVFGALFGALAAIVAGNVSDHTRTRLGRRNPWIITGTVIAAICILGLTFVPYTAVWAVVVLFCGFQVGLNTTLASYTALLPDRVNSKLMGRASAFASFGTLLGSALGGVVVSVLVQVFGVQHLSVGFLMLPWTMVVMMLVVVLAIPGARLRRNPGEKLFDLREIMSTFRPPKDREYWFVYLGRLVFMVGLMMLVQTQTQQLRYHFGLSIEQAASLGAVLGILLAVAAAAATAIAGPLSDRLRRRKAPVIVSVVLFVAGVAVLLLSTETWVLYVNILLAAFAFGAFSSVDQALMVEILPNKETAARDLGFLTTTNTLSGVIGGGIGAIIIGTLGYTALFIIAGLLALACIAFFVPIKRVR